MFTVGVNMNRSSVARHGRSWDHRAAPVSDFAVLSLIFVAASSSISRSATVAALASRANPSIAGSPSALTSVASAWTRWNAGLSRRARFDECTSMVGPRPHFSPLATSSHSTTPFAPRKIETLPSGS